MKTPTSSPLCAVLVGALAGLALPATTSLADPTSDLSSFYQLMDGYNVLTLGNADFSNDQSDIGGAVAVGGQLTIGAIPIYQSPNGFDAASNPSLYVKGGLQIVNNATVQLDGGYASLPGNSGTGTYPYQGNANRYQPSGTSGWLQVASGSSKAASDPRSNPAPSGWTSSTFSNDTAAFTQMSQNLASATATGSVSVSGQTLNFSGGVAGSVVVFNLDMSSTSGNIQSNSNGTTFGHYVNGQFVGQSVTSISFANMPVGATYVINVRNANGQTLFFPGNGFNFNQPPGARASDILWNVVDDSGFGTTSVTLGANGGQFYGSILAPGINLSNVPNIAFNGQILADNLTYNNAEIHDMAFENLSPIPEPRMASAAIVLTIVLAAGLRMTARPGGAPRRAPQCASCAAI